MWYHIRTKLPYDEYTWQAILSLADSPWFERLWVWQEIHLANSRSVIIRGADSIPWPLFQRAIRTICNKSFDLPPKVKEQLDFVCSLCWTIKGQRLPFLVSVSRLAKCTKPVDKIYGMIGLAPNRVASKIRPNYDLPFRQVYKNIFLEHLHLVDRLELFGSCNRDFMLDSYPS